MELFDLVSGAAFAVPAGPICRLRVCLPPISQPTVAPRLSIVVLPFANLSYDPEQQYFADGITDDLTTNLSQIGNMFVISRNTAFTYARTPSTRSASGAEPQELIALAFAFLDWRKGTAADLIRQDRRANAEDPQFSSGPTAPPPKASGLTSVLARNIRVMGRRREREEATATSQERIAAAITRFAGSMRFVYLHVVVFGVWIIINLGLVPGAPEFDPSFVILAMAASVEAIFLSTFILITQNRMSAATEKRAELDLQISLLAEHEVTRLVTLLSAIADRLGIETEHDAEVEELKRDVAPEAVLDEIEDIEERGE